MIVPPCVGIVTRLLGMVSERYFDMLCMFKDMNMNLTQTLNSVSESESESDSESDSDSDSSRVKFRFKVIVILVVTELRGLLSPEFRRLLAPL
jgi:hypothetical protein